jgi:hypothetical protein
MSAQIQQAGTPTNLTASGTISKESGTLLGFYVNNTSSGTMTIKAGASGASTGTAISGTITPAIGFHPFPAYCVSGAYFTLASGSLDVTFFFAAG